MSPVVDVHTHVVPPGWPDLGSPEDPWLRMDSETGATIMLGDREFRRITDACWNADTRLADMDADGIDQQVVLPTPVFFGYDRSPADGARVAGIFNDLALSVTEQAPDRLIPFCQVPLQDTYAACRELDRCIENGHRGVEIGNHVGDRDLDSGAIVDFLQHCADRGVPVFVHPWDMATSERLDRWMLQWLVGMPAETQLSLLSLALSGAFDRLPESLRIGFAHGGGSYAYWTGRADNAWEQRRDLVGADSERPPSAYASRVYVDSVVFSPTSLRVLLDVHGTDRVLLGSDYPYPLGERPAGAVIRSADLDEELTTRLLTTNAQTFLALPTS
ncbi:MAG: amidohydrolase family protein [Actinomycetales bacterium]|nr:amidohydrolase family protein [Actinomycetales bacterium]